MLPVFRSVLLLALTFTSLSAQNGDRRGETQAPLPATIKVPPAPILTPAEELATFKLPPGFRAEVIAADPLIGDPIAMQFGPDGRLWVLEMRGYMPNAEGEGEREPVGVIAVLTDSNGDGVYDQRTVFLDKLVMPRAISLVGDGLLVGEPTRLWFCRDTNGDGACDEKTEVAADFGNITNPEHNSNGLMWAMDNWIYSADWTVRLRYDGGGKFTRETSPSRGQWGLAQDDFGRLFHNSNSDPLRYDPVPSHYLTRNANFSATGANVQLVPATLRVWPGRVTAGMNRGYNSLDEAGKMTAVTAACGPVVYRGTLFPEEFRGDAFIAEPTGNLIKRIKLTDTDGMVRGANAYEGREFMTSTDERFRPVSLYNGPDGALYVVDFYRGIIQHRIYMTSFLRKQVEDRGLDKGIAKGRIWRIVPDGVPKGNFQLGLARASNADLVRELAHASGWVRDTAQRLLVERRDPTVASALAKLATDASAPMLARLHALWTLDGAGSLQPQTVVAALKDPAAQVCAAAIRLAEEFLRAPTPNAEFARAVFALVSTRREPEVRLQLALSLGEARTPEADAALRALAVAAGTQPYVADAIVSGLSGREFQFIALLVKDAAAATASEAVRFAVSAIFKSGDAARIDQALALLNEVTTQAWARREVLAGIRHFLPRAQGGRGGFGGGGFGGGGRGPGGGRGGRGGGDVAAGAARGPEAAAASGGGGRGESARGAARGPEAAVAGGAARGAGVGASGAPGGAGGRGGGGRFGGRGGEPRVFTGSLPAEPKVLVALAAQPNNPEATVATELLASLKWPGKPGAEAAARPLTAAEQRLFEQGKAQFAGLCAACHQPSGQGQPGLAPSLLYSRFVVGDARVLARIVLGGKITENLTMPPWKTVLDDDAIAGVLTFIRRSWGHEADPVTVDVVAAARRDTANRQEPWTNADLDELAQSFAPARR